MPLVEIETAIQASTGPQTHDLDHAANGIGLKLNCRIQLRGFLWSPYCNRL
jgi:hypothetical protein